MQPCVSLHGRIREMHGAWNLAASFDHIRVLYDAEHTFKPPRFRETEKGVWISSVCTEIFELFKNIKLDQFSNFADLGSGDGRVTMIASLFTKATGIEFDGALVHRSRQMKEKLGITNVEFVEGDFLKANLNRYDILFIYPDNPVVGLEDKLIKEGFEGLLVVCGGIFQPDRLVENNAIRINNAVYRMYRRRHSSRLFQIFKKIRAGIE